MGRKALADVMVIVTAISMVMEAVLIMETMAGPSNHVVVS